MNNNYNKIKKRIAFTLAEVLVALTITGIVATLTIPPLIQSIQAYQFKSAFKEAYSIISAVNQRALFDNGGNFYGTTNSNNDSLFNLYKPYLNVVKICTDGNSGGVCWHELNKWTYLDKSPIVDGPYWGWYNVDNFSVMLPNGMFLRFNTYNDCNEAYQGELYCGEVDVDVNGLKGPNVFGKDIFGIYVLSDKIRPLGYGAQSEQNTCTSSTKGLSCAFDILKQ